MDIEPAQMYIQLWKFMQAPEMLELQLLPVIAKFCQRHLFPQLHDFPKHLVHCAKEKEMLWGKNASFKVPNEERYLAMPNLSF